MSPHPNEDKVITPVRRRLEILEKQRMVAEPPIVARELWIPVLGLLILPFVHVWLMWLTR